MRRAALLATAIGLVVATPAPAVKPVTRVVTAEELLL